MYEPATGAFHALTELKSYINDLRGQRDGWMERAGLAFDEGYAAGFRDGREDAANDFHAEVEDWHGCAKGSQ